MSWKVLYEEGFASKDGRWEQLFLLEGPTYPARFYVGPGQNYPIVPRLNGTEFYHRTEDDAMNAFIEMKDLLTK